MDKQRKQRQVEMAERLQTLWLQRMEELILSGEITSTDMATLYRFFNDNGWSVDPASLPTDLKNMLTKNIDPKDLEDPDLRIA